MKNVNFKNCIAKLTSQQKVNSIFFMSLLSNAKTSFVLNRGFHWVKKYEFAVMMMKKNPFDFTSLTNEFPK